MIKYFLKDAYLKNILYLKINFMDLKRFIISNKKIFSVFFTVAISAFVVCTLVYGATTIGTNITTAGNIYATGTIVADGLVNAMGNVYIGDDVSDALTVNSAATFNTTTTLSGLGSDLIVGGVSTSTFAGDLSIKQAGATTTLHIGAGETATSAPGQGGCIALRSSASTTTGVDILYLLIKSNGDNTSLEFATSSVASDCY